MTGSDDELVECRAPFRGIARVRLSRVKLSISSQTLGPPGMRDETRADCWHFSNAVNAVGKVPLASRVRKATRFEKRRGFEKHFSASCVDGFPFFKS